MMRSIRKQDGLTQKCGALTKSMELKTSQWRSFKIFVNFDDSLIVYGNDGLWSAKEKEEIIDCAVQIYLKTSKRQKKVGLPVKRQKLDEVAGELVDPLMHVTDDSDHSNTDSDLCFSDELSESDTDSD